MLTPREYIEQVLMTEVNPHTPEGKGMLLRARSPEYIRLDHAGKGMVTEAAEFTDALKRYLAYGKAYEKVNLIEEMGDQLFYIALACDELNVTLEEVMQKNNDKLKARFGDKFSEEKALTRDLDKEKEALKMICDTSDKTVKVSFTSTNDDIREFIKVNGITVDNVTQIQLDLLLKCLQESFKKFNLMEGTYRMYSRKGSKFMRCKSHYFDKREAVSFNSDGFIGMGGWADSTNVQPIRQGVIDWVNELKV